MLTFWMLRWQILGQTSSQILKFVQKTSKYSSNNLNPSTRLGKANEAANRPTFAHIIKDKKKQIAKGQMSAPKADGTPVYLVPDKNAEKYDNMNWNVPPSEIKR